MGVQPFLALMELVFNTRGGRWTREGIL